MRTFWARSGLFLLERDEAGHLRLTDEFLRAYYLRPELAPIEESCAAERALHARLMESPRAAVDEATLAGIADPDARDNYRLVLALRAHLLAAPTIESAYLAIHREGQAAGRLLVPPLFADQLAHVIVHNILHGTDDALLCRAAELFFREQRISVSEGNVLAADLETVERHASGAQYGSLGRLLAEARTAVKGVDLDILDGGDDARYWSRDEQHDFVIAINAGRPGSQALCQVMAMWIEHFTRAAVRIRPLRAIEDERWRWHIGLDSVSTGILNELYAGHTLEQGKLQQLLALFRLDFSTLADQREDVAGKPVYLGLAMDENAVLHMKPHNVLLNLPLRVEQH